MRDYRRRGGRDEGAKEGEQILERKGQIGWMDSWKMKEGDETKDEGRK